MQNKIKPYEKLKVLSAVVYVCENRNFEKIGFIRRLILYYNYVRLEVKKIVLK
jgi:hypothetical protein